MDKFRKARPQYREYMREYNRKYRAKNAETIKEKERQRSRTPRRKAMQAIWGKRYRLKHKFGLSMEATIEMLAQQDSKCSICKTPVTFKSAVVDHDHSSGKVRGLLCAACNSGLGFFKDSPEAMQNAILYLQIHSSK